MGRRRIRQGEALRFTMPNLGGYWLHHLSLAPAAGAAQIETAAFYYGLVIRWRSRLGKSDVMRGHGPMMRTIRHEPPQIIWLGDVYASRTTRHFGHFQRGGPASSGIAIGARHRSKFGVALWPAANAIEISRRLFRYRSQVASVKVWGERPLIRVNLSDRVSWFRAHERWLVGRFGMEGKRLRVRLSI